MRRFLLAIVGLTLGALAAFPVAAVASHDPSGAPFDHDFVRGSGTTPYTFGNPDDPIRIFFVIAAVSGPSAHHFPP